MQYPDLREAELGYDPVSGIAYVLSGGVRLRLPTNADVGGFRPTMIPGCKFWWEADQIQANDGDAIANVYDHSGGNISISASGTAKPLFKTGVIAGRPALLFDGSDDRFTVGPFTLGTIAIAAKYNLATFASYDGLWGEDGGANNIYFTGTGGGNDWFTARGSLTLYKDNAASSAPVTNAWHIFSATDSSPISLNFEIGQDRTSASRFWNGYVYGIIAYDTALSAADRKRVEQYLGAKVGITI